MSAWDDATRYDSLGAYAERDGLREQRRRLTAENVRLRELVRLLPPPECGAVNGQGERCHRSVFHENRHADRNGFWLVDGAKPSRWTPELLALYNEVKGE